MKISNHLYGLFLFCLPLATFSQQISRPMPAQQQLQLRQGALDEFDNLAYRFEIAWQENDVQSLEEIRPALAQLMQAEWSAYRQLLSDAPARQEKQEMLMRSFEAALPNPAGKQMPTPDRPLPLQQLVEYRELLMQDFNALSEKIKN